MTGSGRGLDALNALVASSQTGFGAFIAVYLTSRAWTQADIGEALSVGTVAAMLSQVPAGALVDRMRSKRLAVAAGGAAVAASALLFAATPARLPVMVAEVLHGFASCMIGPGIAAMSLQLAGQAGMGARLGRNSRFASIGSAVAALVLGGIGTWVSSRSVFWATAGLMAVGLLTLVALPSGAPPDPALPKRDHPRALLSRPLLVFAACVALFHLANAAMLPLVAGEVTRGAGSRANLVIAACIVAPQAVVALVSPWVGRKADGWGRRPVLLLGFAALPVRGVLLALGSDPSWIVAVQALDGISSAVFGVMLPLVASDLSRGTGRFSACMGLLGLAVGAGATLSTWLAGMVADRLGIPAALLVLAGAGCAALATILAMPETRGAPVRFRNA